MKALFALVPLVLALSFAPSPAPAPAVPIEPGGPRCAALSGENAMGRFIFHAVLEGLYEDGVSNAVVDVIAATDPKNGWPLHFVYACPICTPAFDAMRVYRARVPFHGRKDGPVDTFGKGLGEELTKRIVGDDLDQRLKAIEELVQRWISNRMHVMRFTAEERATWSQMFAEGRKKGMATLSSYKGQGLVPTYDRMKECAFCNAANGACK